MYYILHGDEEFTRSERVAQLKARIAHDGMGDLNITTLDGRALELGELINACNAMPFLTQRRLIIVEGLLERFDPHARQANGANTEYANKLAAYLKQLPPSTRLVFVERKTLSRANPILKQALQNKDGHVTEFNPLKNSDLNHWIQERAKEKGAEIAREAVSLLVSFVSEDLRMLDRELEKLAAYANYARPISSQDVRTLVSAAHDANVFALVDAIGLRNEQLALKELHELLASGANELYILTMIARQVRLLLSVKELAEEKNLRPDDIRREAQISHSFILDRLLRQTPRFTMHELETLQRAVLESDQAIKTGEIEAELALELLLIQI
ncbi:MAG: DNA polymerase III subunit delta, partial [Chloroflexi bacterium RBG_13_56_8]